MVLLASLILGGALLLGLVYFKRGPIRLRIHKLSASNPSQEPYTNTLYPWDMCVLLEFQKKIAEKFKGTVLVSYTWNVSATRTGLPREHMLDSERKEATGDLDFRSLNIIGVLGSGNTIATFCRTYSKGNGIWQVEMMEEIRTIEVAPLKSSFPFDKHLRSVPPVSNETVTSLKHDEKVH